MRARFLFLIVLAALMAGCGENTPRPTPPQPTPPVKIPIDPASVSAPQFNADSAYHFIAKQVGFGPRVPNSAGHKECAVWLEAKLKGYGLTTQVQEGVVTAFNGTKLNIRNIMGRYKPDATQRIILFAHWDTRPFADRDDNNKGEPIDGANDGGSGVGVLLELARLIHVEDLKPSIGIDFLFVDAEDYGQPQATMINPKGDTWCLGTQYWASNIPIQNYSARYGICLDMVGGKGATFPKELGSLNAAPALVDKVWRTGERLGYGHMFIDQRFGPITDDHVYMTQIARIPSIDIIHYDMNTLDFGPFHHRHSDNMDVIDKTTLQAVGQVVTQVVYAEN